MNILTNIELNFEIGGDTQNWIFDENNQRVTFDKLEGIDTDRYHCTEPHGVGFRECGHLFVLGFDQGYRDPRKIGHSTTFGVFGIIDDTDRKTAKLISKQLYDKILCLNSCFVGLKDGNVYKISPDGEEQKIDSIQNCQTIDTLAAKLQSGKYANFGNIFEYRVGEKRGLANLSKVITPAEYEKSNSLASFLEYELNSKEENNIPLYVIFWNVEGEYCVADKDGNIISKGEKYATNWTQKDFTC